MATDKESKESKEDRGATPATSAVPATPPAKEEKPPEIKDEALPANELKYIDNEENIKQSQETRKMVNLANPGSIDQNAPVSATVEPTPEEEDNKKKLEKEQKAFEERRKTIPATTDSALEKAGKK